MAEFASKGVGSAGLTTGIIGSALGALNSGLLGGGGILGGGWVPSENQAVNRYEAGQAARIAELETEVKLRDSNICRTIVTNSKVLDIHNNLSNVFFYAWD